MSISVMSMVWRCDALKPYERLVMLAIADCANDDGYAYPGYDLLTKKTGLARPTLAKQIKILKSARLIEVDAHANIGKGRGVNTYQINVRSLESLPVELIEDARRKVQPVNLSEFPRKVQPLKSSREHPKSSTVEHESSVNPSVLKKGTRFKKPALWEIRDYVHENRLNVDPEAFYDHYESNGWKIGKSPMKDWAAALRNWSRRQGKQVAENKPYVPMAN